MKKKIFFKGIAVLIIVATMSLVMVRPEPAQSTTIFTWVAWGLTTLFNATRQPEKHSEPVGCGTVELLVKEKKTGVIHEAGAYPVYDQDIIMVNRTFRNNPDYDLIVRVNFGISQNGSRKIKQVTYGVNEVILLVLGEEQVQNGGSIEFNFGNDPKLQKQINTINILVEINDEDEAWQADMDVYFKYQDESWAYDSATKEEIQKMQDNSSRTGSFSKTQIDVSKSSEEVMNIDNLVYQAKDSQGNVINLVDFDALPQKGLINLSGKTILLKFNGMNYWKVLRMSDQVSKSSDKAQYFQLSGDMIVNPQNGESLYIAASRQNGNDVLQYGKTLILK